MKLRYSILLLFAISSGIKAQMLNIRNGVNTTNVVFTYPIYFERDQCRFQVLGGVVGNNELQNFYHEHCEDKDFKLVIDDYIYDLPEDFTLFYFENSYQIFEMVFLGDCVSLSGGALSSGSTNTAGFSPLSFDTLPDEGLKYYALDVNPMFVIRSKVRDIFCSNGIEFSLEAIFENGFES